MKIDRYSSNHLRKGFSLTEMLVVIGVISVMAGLAIMNFSTFFTESGRSKDMRNAQTVVTVFTSARHAGVVFQSADLDGLMTELVNGASPIEGPLAGHRFAIGSLAADERQKAKKFIRFTPAGPSGDMLMSFDADN